MKTRIMQLLLVLGIAAISACKSAEQKMEALGLPRTSVIIGRCVEVEVEGPIRRVLSDTTKVSVFTFEALGVPWTKMEVTESNRLRVYTRDELYTVLMYVATYKIGDDYFHIYGQNRGSKRGFVMLREEQWFRGPHVSAVKVKLGEDSMWTSAALSQTCSGLFVED